MGVVLERLNIFKTFAGEDRLSYDPKQRLNNDL